MILTETSRVPLHKYLENEVDTQVQLVSFSSHAALQEWLILINNADMAQLSLRQPHAEHDI